MKLILSLLALAALGGCATVSLDLPTRYGHVTATTNGSAVLFGLKK